MSMQTVDIKTCEAALLVLIILNDYTAQKATRTIDLKKADINT